MATRRGRNDEEGERPPSNSKRQRLLEQDESPPSLDSLNDDCLLHIFSHSSIKDLNTLAMCNRRLRAIRAHESLDQTREGIISIREGSSGLAVLRAIADNNWDEEFQGNMTKLKITRTEHLQALPNIFEVEMVARQGQSQLTGVTSLQMTCAPNAGNQQLHAREFQLISLLLPNLVSADLSGLNVFSPGEVCIRFVQNCAQISRFTWNRCNHRTGLGLTGVVFQSAAHLTELYLDDCCFWVFNLSASREFSDPSANTDIYMLYQCRHLERLSIKNATCYCFDPHTVQSISQEMLIKMIRNHPTLQWLRSDLSAENIAMLQEERPEITFVSD